MIIFVDQSCVDQSRYTLRQVVSEPGFSQSMANTDASGGNQSQDGDRGLQAVWRVIEE